MTIVIIRAVIIYFFVVLAVRVMGRRQIGELSTHEFVITILISAVATVPLEDNAIPLTNSLLPILILISLEVIQSALSMKSKGFRKLFEGNPILIIEDGKLNQNEMKRLRITVDDLLDSLRQKNVFDIAEVKNAVVEANGKLSVQKHGENGAFAVPIVCDGQAENKYFGNKSFDKKELKDRIEKAPFKTDAIMLMTIDENGNDKIIKKEK